MQLNKLHRGIYYSLLIVIPIYLGLMYRFCR